MKVRYRDKRGVETTAYIGVEPNAYGVYSGVNKHTDEPVRLYWTGDEWVELA